MSQEWDYSPPYLISPPSGIGVQMTVLNQNNVADLLHYWKTCTPRAQGGYGLAELPPGDQVTINQVVQIISSATNGQENIRVVDIKPASEPINAKRLAATIFGDHPMPGLPVEEYVASILNEHLTILIIDHGEYLSGAAMGWICGLMRKIAQVIIVVTRDVDRLKSNVQDSHYEPGWVFGRSFCVDLLVVRETEAATD